MTSWKGYLSVREEDKSWSRKWFQLEKNTLSYFFKEAKKVSPSSKLSTLQVYFTPSRSSFLSFFSFFIFFLNSQLMKQKEKLGEWNVHKAGIDPNPSISSYKKYCFSLRMGETTLIFSASNEVRKEQWIQALKIASDEKLRKSLEPESTPKEKVALHRRSNSLSASLPVPKSPRTIEDLSSSTPKGKKKKKKKTPPVIQTDKLEEGEERIQISFESYPTIPFSWLTPANERWKYSISPEMTFEEILKTVSIQMRVNPSSLTIVEVDSSNEGFSFSFSLQNVQSPLIPK